MAYILFVNPSILAVAGMPAAGVFLATALAAGIATLLMAFVARIPIAAAPGMGLNAFFAFTLVLGAGLLWEQALAAVLVSGFIYFLITISGLRKKIVEAIPHSMKLAVGAGIGFFIAFIGLVEAGIIVANPATLVGLGALGTATTLLALFGIILTIVLLGLKVRGAVFFGIVGTAFVGVILGLFGVLGMPVFAGVIGTSPTFAGIFGKAFTQVGWVVTSWAGWTAVLSFLFVDFFDTAGTLIAVTSQIPNITEKDIDNANLADSVSTMTGAVLGTSTTTSYIESLAGVGAGARTGFSSVIVGLLFLLSIFFYPLLSVVTPAVTAAAMIIVGTMMSSAILKIKWDDWAVSVAAFITIIMMILTYSISNGIGFGFITYIVAMVAAGRWKEISPLFYVVGFLFLLFFIFLL